MQGEGCGTASAGDGGSTFFRLSPTDYVGLHERYAELMGGLRLADDGGTVPEDMAAGLRKAFDGMMQALFREEGAQLSIEIMEDKAVQGFVESHAQVLDSGFEKVRMSDAMRRRLQRSDYIFSGMKTFHELNEAFPQLVDENGERKSFERFLNDVRKVDETYNRNYLKAEYNFAQASGEMAAKWEQFAQDGDRYYLQYRTTGDDKVRPEHAALDGVTLPIGDSFWSEYFPPNGWNCRCTVVQVRKSRYEATPHDEAMERAQDALQEDKRGMFRFNAGMEGKTFPDYNPYTTSKCRDCDVAKGEMKLARFVAEHEMCQWCEKLRKCAWKEQEKKYKNLLEDKSYTDVRFDNNTGALSATHVGHQTHPNDKLRYWGMTGDELEKQAQNVIFNLGHSCIMEEESIEIGKGIYSVELDATIDDVRMDIRCITQNGKNTIANAICSKNAQLSKFNATHGTEYDSLLLYFHDADMYDANKIKLSLDNLSSELKKRHSPYSEVIKRIICVVNNNGGEWYEFVK